MIVPLSVAAQADRRAAIWDPALPRLLFDASGRELEKTLRLDGIPLRRLRE
jgi:hypothetical protein